MKRDRKSRWDRVEGERKEKKNEGEDKREREEHERKS